MTARLPWNQRKNAWSAQRKPDRALLQVIDRVCSWGARGGQRSLMVDAGRFVPGAGDVFCIRAGIEVRLGVRAAFPTEL
jgi:hypothetical protein